MTEGVIPVAKRSRKYDTEPLVRMIKSYVRCNVGVSRMETAEITQQTYYGRNRTPDRYQLGELRSIMLAYGIPKDEILDAVDKALTG